MKRTSLLLSGGPDSVTLAYHLVNGGFEVNAITFLHHPRGTNSDEVNSAAHFAKILKIEHEVFDVSMLVNIYGNNPAYKFSLGGAKDCIPNGLQQTPLSVHLMLMMAAMNSVARNIYSLNWAIHQDDFINLTEAEFEKTKYLVTELISDEIGRPFEIITPFQKFHKQDIFRLSKTYQLAIEDTVSCFSSVNGEVCGQCIKCVERQNALQNDHIFLEQLWPAK